MQRLPYGAVLVPLLLAATLSAQEVALGTDLLLPLGPAGDVDGDGIDDYTTTDVGTTPASIAVHSGATGLAIPFLASTTALAVVPIGDVDADGHDDLAYLAALEVTVLSGADGATLHTWVFPGTPDVGGGADLDADGCSDVVLHYSDPSGDWIEVRSGRTGLVVWDSNEPADRRADVIGDFDGDGYEDLAITTFDVGGTTWTAEVRKGPTFVLAATLDGSPAFLGDVDADGTTDYTRHVASTPPSTEVRSGPTGAVLTVYPWDPGFRALGDVNGDGHDDFRLQGGAFREILSGATLMLMLPSINMSVLGLDAQRLGDIDGDGRAETNVPGTGQIVEWQDPTLPAASRLVRRGSSGPTSLGTRPRLSTRGHCKLGATIRWDLRGGFPTGLGLFVIGAAIDIDLALLGAPDNRLYCDLQGITLLVTDGNGLATLSSPIPIDPALIGTTITGQGAALDPAANAFGFVTSNAIDVFIED